MKFSSGKPANKHKRLESAGTVCEIHGDDLDDRRACDGCCHSFELDEAGDANRGIVNGCWAHGLVPPSFFLSNANPQALNQRSLSARFVD